MLGLGTKVGGSSILGRDLWSWSLEVVWGLDQPGEGTASRGALYWRAGSTGFGGIVVVGRVETGA